MFNLGIVDKEEKIMKYKFEKEYQLQKGDTFVDQGIIYAVEEYEKGELWGVSNNAEVELFIEDDFVPDAAFRGYEPL
jgi:hypothetical protein|tara:strand:- start:189 stop:419 length:231 start_codon:yes stop_codon:yes gene_type:complete